MKQDKKQSTRGLIPYYGEFMISPIPLELSGNHCSHGCDYCFANLNQPGAKFDEKATIRLVENFNSRKSLTALLLQKKYPILISNRSDPFSRSNAKQFVPLMEKLTELGIPISIQTRGGDKSIIDKVLEFLPPSVWYISIPHDQEKTREQVERFAPTIRSRLELILLLREKGHRVLVGVNPLVKEWLKSPIDFFAKLKVMGVEGVWLEPLHLVSHVQRGNMTSRQKNALGEDLMSRAMKRTLSDSDTEFFMFCHELCINLGLPSYSIGQPIRSNFFRPFYEVYENVFPNTQGFLNWCIDNSIKEFGFEKWFNFFSGSFPELDSSQISLFLYTALRYNRRDCDKVIAELGRPRNYLDLLKAIWNGQKFCPSSALVLGNEAFQRLDNGRIKVCQGEDED